MLLRRGQGAAAPRVRRPSASRPRQPGRANRAPSPGDRAGTTARARLARGPVSETGGISLRRPRWRDVCLDLCPLARLKAGPLLELDLADQDVTELDEPRSKARGRCDFYGSFASSGSASWVRGRWSRLGRCLVRLAFATWWFSSFSLWSSLARRLRWWTRRTLARLGMASGGRLRR